MGQMYCMNCQELLERDVMMTDVLEVNEQIPQTLPQNCVTGK